MAYWLIFIICLLIGNSLGLCLYDLYKVIAHNLTKKKFNESLTEHFKYCEENNLCPPGVTFTQWQLEKKVWENK